MTTHNGPSRQTGRRTDNAGAFSLVELLVVIGIIVLLASIALPTLTAVKEHAKATATAAILNSLDSALETYRAESKLGREYPPSFWDMSNGTPYNSSPDNKVAFGAQTLLWGLAGADLLGTPGWPDLTTGLPRMGNGTSGGEDQLYYIDPNGDPFYPRYGPFFDISKMKIRRPADIGITVGSSVGGTPGDSSSPVLVDYFDMPILYYNRDASHRDVQMYKPSDNIGFLDASRDTIHADLAFYKYIVDKRAYDPDNPSASLSPIPVPHNRDTYLLISAGPDRKYGTRDDVTNFPHNPQQK